MVFCRMNGKQYIMDFDKMEIFSVSTGKSFQLSKDCKVTSLKNYLSKHDI